LAVFVADRVTKGIVNATVPYGTETPLLGNLVAITNIRNAGAAFGFAPVGPWFFLVAALAVSVGLIVYVLREPGDLSADAVLGLILGGALGNAFDRVINGGGVTDFIDFHFWPVFNVADSAVSIGVVLLILGYLVRKPNAG
jgi:signal peptidase II